MRVLVAGSFLSGSSFRAFRITLRLRTDEPIEELSTDYGNISWLISIFVD